MRKFADTDLTPAQVLRARPWYRQLWAWVQAVQARTPRRPLVVGISGPQGGGKSSLAEALVAAARGQGQRAITLSTDDMYRTRKSQVGLHERNPDCVYWRQRGYPGTHDVPLGCAVLEELRAGRPVWLPRYDKSAHAGEGDRRPVGEFVAGRQELLLFEGWTLGFAPLADPSALEPGLRQVNQALAAYAPWNAAVDAWILLRAQALDDIVRWRVESEHNRARRGEATMGEAAARRYVERCLPAYRVYVPPLWEAARRAPTLRLWLGADRAPLTHSR